MDTTLRRLTSVIIIIALSGAFSCAINPVTGKREIMLVPESQEIEMGKSTDQSIRQQYGFYQDAALTSYVDRVGQRIVPYTHRNKLEYHFAVLDTPIENAFAAPGGYVYVTRGLLAMMNSEAELATVLGHELGHVNARHAVREYSKQLLLTGGLLIGSVLNRDVAKVAPYLMVGLQVLFLKFSRDDEYQADSLGVLYSRSAGYSPSQMIPFFKSIEKLEEKSGSGTKLPNFLSTHPLTEKRIEEAQKGGDEAGQLLLNQQLVGVSEHKMWAAELMGKSVNGVFHESGNPRGLNSVARHVSDQKTDATVLGEKDIVEIATYACFFGGRTVQVAKAHAWELARDME